jgi:FlaA1/EpsC-like NDP-sugar epimerase
MAASGPGGAPCTTVSRLRILITGGAGFLGRGVAVALRDRHEVWLGSRDHAANAAAEAQTGCPALPLDVTSIESLRDALAAVRPELIVHAAAAKHVGYAEREPMECVDVNVRGTQNVARVAIECGLAGVVGISSDKAAPPVTSLYGLSKALGERLFAALDAKSSTPFVSVRLGNLAWSPGSVLCEWKRMHDAGGPIRSTGPDMRRFFLDVEQAAALVTLALEQRDALRGAVLAQLMQAAQIRELLSVWTDCFGGRWEPVAPRLEDNEDEWLVGETEAPATEERTLAGGHRCLVLSRGHPVADPIRRGLSTADAPRLDRTQIEALLRAGVPAAR